MRKRLQALALLGGALAILLLAVLFWSSPDDVVSTREAARKLVREARRERLPLRDVQCARSEDDLPRSFLCFGEGAFDTHVVYRVVVRPDGRILFRVTH